MTGDETTRKAIERLWAEIDRRQDELIETVSELVRRPSPLGAEAEAQAYVAEHLTASGLDVDVWDLDESIKALPNAGDSGVPFAGRPNVAGIQRGSGGGRSLIVQGHIDVVSPEPVAAWSYDPWQPTIVGDRMYGRGAYDMKSGDALNLLLPRLLRDLGIQLAGDLIIQSVIEEECTGNGALEAARRYQADAAVITEPTGGRSKDKDDARDARGRRPHASDEPDTHPGGRPGHRPGSRAGAHTGHPTDDGALGRLLVRAGPSPRAPRAGSGRQGSGLAAHVPG